MFLVSESRAKNKTNKKKTSTTQNHQNLIQTTNHAQNQPYMCKVVDALCMVATQTPHHTSKTEPFRRNSFLLLASVISSLLNVSEIWNADRLVNQNVHLLAQFSCHHHSLVQHLRCRMSTSNCSFSYN